MSDRASRSSGSKKVVAEKIVWPAAAGSGSVGENSRTARSARARTTRERISRLLDKYHPNTRPKPSTMYGSAATGGWTHWGRAWGRRKPSAARKTRPPGNRKAKRALLNVDMFA